MSIPPKIVVPVLAVGVLLAWLLGCVPGAIYKVREVDVFAGGDDVIATAYGARDDADKAPLHPAVVEYILCRSELPLVVEEGNEAELALVREIASTVMPSVNESLVDSGIATINPFTLGGDARKGERKTVELLVSRRAMLVVVRMYRNQGNMAGFVFAGLDVADLPEAFDPTAALTVDDVARRARWLEEVE